MIGEKRFERITQSAFRFPAAVFVILVGLLATWALATPLFASPDEPAHLYKAYGSAHFEAIGTSVPGLSPTIRMFDVPDSMGTPDLNCYFGKPETSAACASDHAGKAVSTAAVLPPFWYALVGGGARILGASESQRAYRMMNALLCAAMFAAAFAAARSSSHRRLTPFLLLALTPMSLFLAGTVHPNGFEIAVFTLLWALVLHLHRPKASTRFGGLLVGSLFAAVLLSRFGAMIWVLTLPVVVVALLGRTGLSRFMNRRFLVALGTTTVAAVLALVAWSKYAGVSVHDDRVALDWSKPHIISFTVRKFPELARQMIGVLGWLDTTLPRSVYALYAFFTGLLLVGVVLSKNRRLMAATLLLMVALCGAPVVVNVISAPTAGVIWQGRYSMPIFVGFAVLGMLGWHEYLERGSRERLAAPLRFVVCACFALAEIRGFWQALRRFTVGAHGKVWLTEPLSWSPPIAPMVLIGANAILTVGLCVVVLRCTSVGAQAPTGAALLSVE